MVGPNRIDKYVWATGQLPSLSAAAQARTADVTIRITGQDDTSARLAVRTLVALALRCCTGVIHLHLHDAPLSVASREAVRTEALDEAEDFDEPRRIIIDDGITRGLCLAVGPHLPGHMSAWGDQWVAHINQPDTSPFSRAHAPAIVFAAAAVMSKAFATQVLGHGRLIGSESWSFDVLSQRPTDVVQAAIAMPPSLGRIALLGAGAIGSAVAFVLRHADVEAQVDIIDFDTFSPENRETTLTIHANDYRHGRYKADALANHLNGSAIKAIAIKRRLGIGDPVLTTAYDTFMVAVDNVATRRILDDTRSSCLLNAALGGRREDAGHVLLSSHTLGSRPLSHLYSEHGESTSDSSPVPAEITDRCSRLAFNDASLAAPFMSAAAGSLLVGATAARSLGLPTAAYLKLSLLQQQRFIQRN